MGSITIVGLGPGPFGCLSLETWDVIRQAPKLLLRTAVHPTVEDLRSRGVAFTSYDTFYDQGEDFDSVYRAIADDVIEQARVADVVFAVPGSPMVAEKTVGLIREAAVAAGLPIVVLPGMSFFELLCNRLGIDWLDRSTRVIEGVRFVGTTLWADFDALAQEAIARGDEDEVQRLRGKAFRAKSSTP